MTTSPSLCYIMVFVTQNKCNMCLPHGKDKGTCVIWLHANKTTTDSHITQLSFNHRLRVTGIESVFQHWLMPKSAAVKNESVCLNMVRFLIMEDSDCWHSEHCPNNAHARLFSFKSADGGGWSHGLSQRSVFKTSGLVTSGLDMRNMSDWISHTLPRSYKNHLRHLSLNLSVVCFLQYLSRSVLIITKSWSKAIAADTSFISMLAPAARA